VRFIFLRVYPAIVFMLRGAVNRRSIEAVSEQTNAVNTGEQRPSLPFLCPRYIKK
jgi:hypothetical protein